MRRRPVSDRQFAVVAAAVGLVPAPVAARLPLGTVGSVRDIPAACGCEWEPTFRGGRMAGWRRVRMAPGCRPCRSRVIPGPTALLLAFAAPGGDGHTVNGAVIAGAIVLGFAVCWLGFEAVKWARDRVREWRAARRLIADVRNPDSGFWDGINDQGGGADG